MPSPGSTLNVGSGGAATPTYEQRVLDGIAKLKATAPWVGDSLENAYLSRSAHSPSLLGGLWNGVTQGAQGIGGAIFGVLGNVQSAFAEPFRQEEEGEEDFFIEDFVQGLFGKENTHWKDNIKSWGLGEGPVQSTAGFVLDVIADPLTYVGSGGLGLAKGAVAEGASELGKLGIRESAEAAARKAGGVNVHGKFISFEDDFVSTISKHADEAMRGDVKDPMVREALAGMAGHAEHEKVIKSVSHLLDQEAAEAGKFLGDTVMRTRNLQRLPDTWTAKTTGRTFTKDEMLRIFHEAQDYTPSQMREAAKRLYGPNPTTRQINEFGRLAASAMGGVRLKFGIPFGHRMADRFNKPWLGYRYQTHAMSTRFMLGDKEFAATKVGDFFRGLSGIQRVNTAVQSALKTGNTQVWDSGAMDAFLHSEEGGYLGLRRYLYNKGPEGVQEWDRVFGSKMTSMFVPMSERAGRFTESIDKAARSWRRDGIIGFKSAHQRRTAQQAQKNFRQIASEKYLERWAKPTQQLVDEAKEKGPEWLNGVYDNIIAVVEGTNPEAIKNLPEYLAKIANDIGPAFEELHTMLTKRFGVSADSISDVFVRHRYERALEGVRKRIDELDNELEEFDTVGADVVEAEGFAAQKQALDEELDSLLAQEGDIATQLKNMDTYDEIAEAAGISTKASPRRFFRHLPTAEAKAAIKGNLLGTAKTSQKPAGVLEATLKELNAEIAPMSFKEADQHMRAKYGDALKDVANVLDNNPMRVFAQWVDDMSEEVLKTQLDEGVNYIVKRFGAIDNGTMHRAVSEMVDPEWMPVAYRAVTEGLEQMSPEGKAAALGWLEDFESRIGVTLAGDVPNPTEPYHKTFGEFFDEAENIDVVAGARQEFDELDRIGNASREEAAELIGKGDTAKVLYYGQWRMHADKLEMLKNNQPYRELTDADLEKYGHRWAWIRDKRDKYAKLEAASRSRLLDSLPEDSRLRRVLGDDPELMPSNLSGADEAAEGVEDAVAAGRRDTLRREHMASVAKAVKEGQTVPAKVLREYPNILQQMIKIPENMSTWEKRSLQTAFRGLNQLRAQLEGAVAWPEVALKHVDNVPNKSLWSKLEVPGLEDFLMHPYMAKEFNQAWHNAAKTPADVNAFRRAYRKHILGPWKEWATLHWPGFHARNMMGAWYNNELGGVGSLHYREFRKINDVINKGRKSEYWGKPYAVAKRMKIDGVVQDVTYTDLAAKMVNDGIVGSNGLALADIQNFLSARDFTALDPGHGISSKIKIGKVSTKEWGDVTGAEFLFRKWRKWGIDKSTRVENFYRGAAYLKGLEDGLGDTAAARMFVMMRHGDYDELTDFENVIKDVLPFYKWMRTNVPYQLRQLIESPGKQLATLKAGDAIVDEAEKQKLPGWMQENILVKLPWSNLNSKEKRDEAGTYMMMELPIHDLFMSTNEFFSGFLPVSRQLVLENMMFERSSLSQAPLEGERVQKLGLWSKIPGLSHAMEATGYAERDADGDLVIDDKTANLLTALPIYSRTRNFIHADPERTRLRMGALVSMMSGIGVRPIGDEDLDNAEAEYFFNFVDPQIKKLQNMGYEFPTAQSFTTTSKRGSRGV